MAQHSVADARNGLSALIDRALAGEEVVITRHGQPVVVLAPIRPEPRRMTRADWDEMADNLIETTSPLSGAELVRQMRDEGF